MGRPNQGIALLVLGSWLVGLTPLRAAIPDDAGSALKSGRITNFERGAVYVYGDPALDTLTPIRLLGAVNKAGIHYVPENTDLLTLVTLAGGVSESASLDDVTIKRRLGTAEYEVLTVNLDDLVTAIDAQPVLLKTNDMVLVQKDEPVLSPELLRTVGFLAGLATIFGTVTLGLRNIR